MNIRSKHGGALAALAASLLLGGCAVQSNGNGGILLGVDNAQLFGTTISTFQVKSGAEGTLRRAPNNGPFSIKLSGSMRVVPLPNAQLARIARVVDMGTRTVVVVETQERNCPFRYQVLSIEGSDVLQWGIGSCADRPRVEVAEGGQALYFDFAASGRLQRNIYIDGRMLNAGTVAAPGINLGQRPFADADLHAPGGAIVPWQAAPPQQVQQGQPGSQTQTPPAPRTPQQQSQQTQQSQQRGNGSAPTRATAAVNPSSTSEQADHGRVVPLPPQKADGVAAAAAPASSSPSSSASSSPSSSSPSSPPPATPSSARRPAAKAAGQTPPPMTIPTEEVKVIHLDLRQ